MSLRSTIRWVNTRYFDSLFLGSNFSLFLFSLFPPAFFSFFIPFSTSPYSSHLFFYSLTRPPHFPLSPHLPYSFLYICFTSSFAWWFFPIFVFFFFFYISSSSLHFSSYFFLLATAKKIENRLLSPSGVHRITMAGNVLHVSQRFFFAQSSSVSSEKLKFICESSSLLASLTTN